MLWEETSLDLWNIFSCFGASTCHRAYFWTRRYIKQRRRGLNRVYNEWEQQKQQLNYLFIALSRLHCFQGNPIPQRRRACLA